MQLKTEKLIPGRWYMVLGVPAELAWLEFTPEGKPSVAIADDIHGIRHRVTPQALGRITRQALDRYEDTYPKARRGQIHRALERVRAECGFLTDSKILDALPEAVNQTPSGDPDFARHVWARIAAKPPSFFRWIWQHLVGGPS
jgi:hypothetical protein